MPVGMFDNSAEGEKPGAGEQCTEFSSMVRQGKSGKTSKRIQIMRKMLSLNCKNDYVTSCLAG